MSGQRIGSMRVSSFDQNPERHLEGVAVDRVFTDKASGKDTKRPALDRLITFTGADSPMATLMRSVMGAFTEFERALINERQRECIALAKQRGAYQGRTQALSAAQAAELRRRAPLASAARPYISI
jgi:DNA invertase Pin-like site-specific DNA recombinase